MKPKPKPESKQLLCSVINNLADLVEHLFAPQNHLPLGVTSSSLYAQHIHTHTLSLTPHTPSISSALTVSKIVHLLRTLQKLASFPY